MNTLVQMYQVLCLILSAAVVMAVSFVRRVFARLSVAKLQLLAFLAVLFAPLLSFATSVFDPLTTAVTFTDAVTAIFAVAAILAGLSVTITGIMIVWKMIKKGKSA